MTRCDCPAHVQILILNSPVPLPPTNTSCKYQPSTYNTLGVKPVRCTPLRIGILTREFQYFT